MVRKRIRVIDLPSAKQRMRYAQEMIQSINDRLANGWNPLIHNDVKKATTSLMDACSAFLTNKKDVRPDTMRSYTSFIRLLQTFMQEKEKRMLRVNEWTKEKSIAYLHWVHISRNNSARTHNNHRDFCILLWNWLIAYEYAYENPFKEIPSLRTPKKRRTVIPAHERQMIAEYFQNENPTMRLICELIFSTGLRRTEITKLRVKDIDLGRYCIYVGHSVAKMGDERTPTLTENAHAMLKAHISEDEMKSHYLIGDQWGPGKRPMAAKKLSDTWARMRKVLELEGSYQLYGLRDSGIEFMFEMGLDAKTIMHQYGHKSLEMTTRYAIRSNPRTVELIKTSGGGF